MRSVAVAILFGLLTCSISFGSSEPSPEKISQNLEPNKWINFRADPIGLLFYIWGGSIDFGLGRSWSIGPSVDYFFGGSTKRNTAAYEAGVTFCYYFSGTRFTNSWYVRPAIYYIPVVIRVNDLGVNTQATFNNYAVGSVFGRAWNLPWGFSMNAGVGLEYYVAPNSGSSGQYTDHLIQPILEFNVGWAL